MRKHSASARPGWCEGSFLRARPRQPWTCRDRSPRVGCRQAKAFDNRPGTEAASWRWAWGRPRPRERTRRAMRSGLSCALRSLHDEVERDGGDHLVAIALDHHRADQVNAAAERIARVVFGGVAGEDRVGGARHLGGWTRV